MNPIILIKKAFQLLFTELRKVCCGTLDLDGNKSLVAVLKCHKYATHLVINGPGYIQMSLATNHRFIVPSQELQRVPQVAAGFCLAELVADCSEISEKERKKIIRGRY